MNPVSYYHYNTIASVLAFYKKDTVLVITGNSVKILKRKPKFAEAIKRHKNKIPM